MNYTHCCILLLISYLGHFGDRQYTSKHTSCGERKHSIPSGWKSWWLSLINPSVVHDSGRLGGSKKIWKTFEMSVCQEALKSKDHGEVKFARGKIKIQVTTALNKLELVLGKNEDGGFDHNKIVQSEVERQFSKLKECFVLFETLHQNFCYLRPVGATEAQETELQNEDKEYFSDSEQRWEKINTLYNEYSSSVKQKAEAASLASKTASLRKKFDYEKEAYDCSIAVAQEKLKTFQEAKEKKGLDKSFPAMALHEDVKEKYGVVLKTYKELESLEGNGSKETKPLAEFKHSEEAKKVGSILFDLLAASELIKGL